VVNRGNRNRKKNDPPEQNSNTREKETIIKEIVMIPCPYCGALTPVTSLFCPNCGASRKS